MQENSTLDDAVNLAVAMREDGVRLWSYRYCREAEVHLAAYHVQNGSCSYEVELIRRDGTLSKSNTDYTNDKLTVQQEEESCDGSDTHEEVEVPLLTEDDVTTGSLDVYSVEDGEHIGAVRTVTKEEAMVLQDETRKMWQLKSLVTVEGHYQEQLTLMLSSTDDHHDIDAEVDTKQQSPTVQCSHEGLEHTDSLNKQEDVMSDSEESYHSLEEFMPDELLAAVESGSDCYDDAEGTLFKSTSVQVIAPEVNDASSQTTSITSHSIDVQTDDAHLLDASVNTVTMTTSDASTNTTITKTDNATTNTVTMVTVDNATNTVTMEMTDVETNTVPKITNDAIIQTEKLLVSRSQSEYESLIDKYKKYIEALKAEVTQEKSQRLVAEQMVSIVQSEVESLRQRNIDLTSRQIKLENELSETKVY